MFPKIKIVLNFSKNKNCFEVFKHMFFEILKNHIFTKIFEPFDVCIDFQN